VSDSKVETDGHEPEHEHEHEHEHETVAAVWFAMPLWRLWLFTLLGGGLFQIYWLYCGWAAYRRSWGYSKQQQWRSVYLQTGYRVSPFWRAVLQVHSYALLAAIWREARVAGIRRMGSPGLWFVMQMLTLVVGVSMTKVWWSTGVLSLTFLPAQATVNRLSDAQGGARAREPMAAGELVCLLVGAALVWAQVVKGLHR
jgi:hypothetical protein